MLIKSYENTVRFARDVRGDMLLSLNRRRRNNSQRCRDMALLNCNMRFFNNLKIKEIRIIERERYFSNRCIYIIFISFIIFRNILFFLWFKIKSNGLNSILLYTFHIKSKWNFIIL